MASFLTFAHPKPFWKKSIKMKESPHVAADISDKSPELPVTVAVVGCGQRGKVSVSPYIRRLV